MIDNAVLRKLRRHTGQWQTASFALLCPTIATPLGLVIHRWRRLLAAGTIPICQLALLAADYLGRAIRQALELSAQHLRRHRLVSSRPDAHMLDRRDSAYRLRILLHIKYLALVRLFHSTPAGFGQDATFEAWLAVLG